MIRSTAKSNVVRFGFAFTLVAGSLFSQGPAADPSTPAPEAHTTPMVRQEVWRAVRTELRERGLSDAHLPEMEDLDLPPALAAVAGRKLRVSSACWEPVPQRTQFRLECGEPGQCLSFLVYLRDDHARNRGEGQWDESARPPSCRLEPGSRSAPEGTPKPLRQPAMRVGDHATAVFISNRVRIAASVTCLERGRDGEVIRVRSEGGEVFRARISGPALLEAVPQ